MIIINEYTEKALTERLETIRTDAEQARCIHFAFAGTPILPDTITPTMTRYVEGHIETTDQCQLYICEDGDMYLLGNSMSAKHIQFFIKYVGDAMNQNIKDKAAVYELPTQVNHVLTSVDSKLQLQVDERQTTVDHDALARQEQKRKSILEVVNKSHAQASIAQTRSQRSKPQIMVIEDDAFTRQLIVNIMQKRYPIAGTGNPAEALSSYVRLAPDVLFLDINLPDVTGHELLDSILELDPDAYVVMLSGNADKENITTAMSKGAKGFVGKPFTSERLLQYIEKRLNP